MLVKYSAAKIVRASVDIADVLPRSFPRTAMARIASLPFLKTGSDNYIYTSNRAISALESWSANDNGDAFPRAELVKGYPTFFGCPVTVDHVGYRDIGAVIASEWTPVSEKLAMFGLPARVTTAQLSNKLNEIYSGLSDTERADLLVTLAAEDGDTWDMIIKRYANFDYVTNAWVTDRAVMDADTPGMSQALLDGEITDTSMGTLVEASVCSVPGCYNVAREEADYCEHIRSHKGCKAAVLAGSSEPVHVYEVNYGLEFFEDSLILPAALGGVAGGAGADPNAKVSLIGDGTTEPHEVAADARKASTLIQFVESRKTAELADEIESDVPKLGGEPPEIEQEKEKLAREAEEVRREEDEEKEKSEDDEEDEREESDGGEVTGSHDVHVDIHMLRSHGIEDLAQIGEICVAADSIARGEVASWEDLTARLANSYHDQVLSEVFGPYLGKRASAVESGVLDHVIDLVTNHGMSVDDAIKEVEHEQSVVLTKEEVQAMSVRTGARVRKNRRKMAASVDEETRQRMQREAELAEQEAAEADEAAEEKTTVAAEEKKDEKKDEEKKDEKKDEEEKDEKKSEEKKSGLTDKAKARIRARIRARSAMRRLQARKAGKGRRISSRGTRRLPVRDRRVEGLSRPRVAARRRSLSTRVAGRPVGTRMARRVRRPVGTMTANRTRRPIRRPDRSRTADLANELLTQLVAQGHIDVKDMPTKYRELKRQSAEELKGALRLLQGGLIREHKVVSTTRQPHRRVRRAARNERRDVHPRIRGSRIKRRASRVADPRAKTRIPRVATQHNLRSQSMLDKGILFEDQV